MITKEKIDNFIKILKNENQKEFIKIKIKKSENLPLTVSKFGGLPFLDKNSEIPKTENGEQLFLLAQINCEELPENNIYPKKGILQFWILADAECGISNYKVNYILDLENGFSEDEVKKIYNPFIEDEYFIPLEGEFSLDFEIFLEGISYFDYSFDDILIEKWNKNFPENNFENRWELNKNLKVRNNENGDIEFYFGNPNLIEGTESFMEYIFNGLSYENINHKIGGYPYFTQFDPRTGDKNLQKYDTLLLQIDSEYDNEENGYKIIWGDVGVANFFISKENLEKLDFSEVLYNWDCS